jgi:predicted methyltransferase
MEKMGMIETIYGIHVDDSVVFFTLDAAEEYAIQNYPEYCGHKDAAFYFCEDNIWEDRIIECCFCKERETEETLEMNGLQMRRSNCGDYHWHLGCSS